MRMGIGIGSGFGGAVVASGGGGGLADPDNLVFHVDAGDVLSYPGSGTTWFDLTDNNNDGTLTGDMAYVGTSPQYMNLDGTGDYSTGHNTTSLSFANDGVLTAMGFFYPIPHITGQHGYAGVMYSRSAQANGLHVSAAGDRWAYTWNGQGYTYSTGPLLVNNEWQMVTWQINSAGTQISLYQDGETTVRATHVFSHGTSTKTMDALEVGRDSFGTRTFKGYIGQCALWDVYVADEDLDTMFENLKGRYF